MSSAAGPYQMDREPGAPFGVFNLAKFRAEVRSRVDVARNAAADEASGSSYMNTRAYDSPPPRTAGTAHSQASIGSQRVNLQSRLMSRDADEAMEKMQRRAESTMSHARFPPLDSKDASTRRSTSSLDVVRAPRSSAFLAPDPFKPDRMQWTTPEKWYALSQHSAQNNSQLEVVRNQTQRPAMPTLPSENPFSCPPARINKFSDISPNPRLIDGRKKKRRSDEGSKKGATAVGLAKFGHMRKCQNPFTEGWKVATFKPAREKLVPYTARVKKWIKGAGYGFIDLDGQEIFVHLSEVKSGQPLKAGDSVTFLLHSGVTSKRGLPEAHNVVPDDGLERIPENMSKQEYQDLQSRRKLDEDLRGMFDTAFWKYPKSEETLPVEDGGIPDEELYSRGIVSRHYTPYEQSISFDRKMTMVNPLTNEQAARQKPPDLSEKLDDDNGPNVAKKLERKPWLGKFLAKSTSRHPLAMPELESYYTSPVVNSTDHSKPTQRISVHESAAMSPTRMRAQMNPPPEPPVPVRNDKLRDMQSRSLNASFNLSALSG